MHLPLASFRIRNNFKEKKKKLKNKSNKEQYIFTIFRNYPDGFYLHFQYDELCISNVPNRVDF